MTADPAAPHSSHDQIKDNGATPRGVDWGNPRVAAILDAAAKCFARKGFSATTLAEIGKELGLRKSIVHYYFASKAALIHEVQSYTYQRYLDRVKDAILASGGGGDPAHTAMRALWTAVGEGDVGLNIEVWSASRNDDELKRRAQALQEEKRKVIEAGLRALLGPEGASRIPLRPLSTLVMSVLNGLAVSEYVEGPDAQVQNAYEMFLTLLTSGGRQPGTLSHAPQGAPAPASHPQPAPAS
jgi:AcrR family transcriptional regulator